MARLFPRRHGSAQSGLAHEPHVNCRTRKGQDGTRAGKIASFHLARLLWPDPSPPQTLGEPPRRPRAPGKLWSSLQRQANFWARDLSPEHPFKCSLGCVGVGGLGEQGMFVTMQIHLDLLSDWDTRHMLSSSGSGYDTCLRTWHA